MAAHFNGPFHHAQAHYGQLAGGTGNDDVKFGKAVRQIVQVDGLATDFFGQGGPAFQSAVSHRHALGFLRGKVLGTQFYHFPRANEQDFLFTDIAKNALR